MSEDVLLGLESWRGSTDGQTLLAGVKTLGAELLFDTEELVVPMEKECVCDSQHEFCDIVGRTRLKNSLLGSLTTARSTSLDLTGLKGTVEGFIYIYRLMRMDRCQVKRLL